MAVLWWLAVCGYNSVHMLQQRLHDQYGFKRDLLCTPDTSEFTMPTTTVPLAGREVPTPMRRHKFLIHSAFFVYKQATQR